MTKDRCLDDNTNEISVLEYLPIRMADKLNGNYTTTITTVTVFNMNTTTITTVTVFNMNTTTTTVTVFNM